MATNDVQSTSHQIEEHKRVSFGGEKQIVYDDGVADDYTLTHQPQHVSKHNNAFTETNAPPNKVTVRSENSEVPRPISPPAQLSNGHAADAPLISVSPALPSFLRKMESESCENPFRPEESLYHEVDPIVEAYRQRPFPPSPSGSPVPPPVAGASPTTATVNGGGQHYYGSGQTTPAHRTTSRQPEFGDRSSASPDGNVQHGYYEHTTVTTTTNTVDGADPNTTTVVTTTTKRNGSGGGTASRTASLAEARKGQDPPYHHHHQQQPLIADGTQLPPPHKAEIVHIEEKKRKCCLCCCLQ